MTRIHFIVRSLKMKFPTDVNNKSYAKTSVYQRSDEKTTVVTQNVEPHAVNDKGEVKRKGRGSDDSFFEKRPELHRVFPRGLSITTISHEGSDEKKTEHILRGFFKFSGRSQMDEDDSTPCKCLQPKDLDSLYSHVLRIEKLNGKFAVARLVQYGGEPYLIGGSKGVHRCVSLENFKNDISKLDKKSQQLVVPILRLFYQQYMECPEETRQEVLEHLSTSKYTMCGEYEDGQHLEEHVGPARLRWFGLAYSGDDFSSETSLSGNIVKDLQLLTSWGFPTPKYSLLTREQDLANRSSERHLRGREGYVKHYLRITTPIPTCGSEWKPMEWNWETVFVEKTKTTWYVLVRVLREVVRGCDNIMAQAPGKIAARLRARNSFLHLPETMLVIWYRLMLKFCQWFVDKGYEKSVIGITDEAKGMGNIWGEFLRENPELTDDFGDPLVYLEGRPLESLSDTFQNRLLVVLQGIPGLGKSVLAEWIKNHSWLCETLEQDTYNGNRDACLQALVKMLASPAQVIILARNNAQPRQYCKFIQAANEAGWKTLAVTPKELLRGGNMDQLLSVCVEAVKTRTGHATFDKLSMESRVKTVRSFRSQFKPATITSELHHLYHMSYLDSPSDTSSSRRSLESLGSELLGVIREKMVAPPEPVYMGVPLPGDFRDHLVRLIVEKMEITDDSKCLVDHTTLIHNSDMMTKPELWSRIKSKCGQRLKIRVKALHLKHKTHAVFECELFEPDDTDASQLVSSGFAHITGVLPKTESASISLKLHRSDDFTHTYFKSSPLECVSVVTANY